MKTIVHIELTDEERLAIGGGRFMVSRKEVTGLVNKFIEDLKNEDTRRSDAVELPRNEETEALAKTIAATGRDCSIREFVPSRGDEPYLYDGEDPELTDACRAVLDGLQFIEGHAWAALEGNRK